MSTPIEAMAALVVGAVESVSPNEVRVLERHGIRYDSLVMSPYSSFGERDRAGDSAQRKAAAYLADPSLRLFVESDDAQARHISTLTGRPVFSVVRNGLV